MSTPLLRVEGLRKSFGGVAALKDGRFELAPVPFTRSAAAMARASPPFFPS